MAGLMERPDDTSPPLTGDEGQRALRVGGWSPLARDVVRVEGSEATAFLQGQLSADIAAVEEGDAVWSLLLSPAGKVVAWLRATRLHADTWLLDVDAGAGAAVEARLQRFKLRTKAEIAVDPSWRFRAVRGPAELDLRHPAEAHVLALPVWWPGLVGYDIVAGGDPPVSLGLPEVAPEALDAVRIECGVPAVGAEATEDTIPAELGPWLIEASVSFTKGCYTGQELVARVDSRGGNVPRPVRGVVVEGEVVPPPGAAVLAGDREVGHLTSTARSAALDAPVALAVVGRAVEPGHTVRVTWAGGDAVAEVRALPLVGGGG
jgi:folate-binding protein YgfZ